MKTLVNKNNQAIRITAPEIEEYLNNYFISCNDTAGRSLILQKSDWTLVEEEQPDKETILRICKLHKAWSIMAPWENVEDFVKANWNAENIV